MALNSPTTRTSFSGVVLPRVFFSVSFSPTTSMEWPLKIQTWSFFLLKFENTLNCENT